MGVVVSTSSILPRVFVACWLIASGAVFAGFAAAQTAPANQPNTATQPAGGGPAPGGPEKQQRAAETPAVVMGGDAAATVLGMPVRSVNGADLGRIVDVVVDRFGNLRAAVIDFGGFLGVGTRKIAVDWRVLHFPDKGGLDRLVADLQRDQLRSAPVYKPGEPIVIIGAAASKPAAAPAPAPPPHPTAPAPKP